MGFSISTAALTGRVIFAGRAPLLLASSHRPAAGSNPASLGFALLFAGMGQVFSLVRLRTAELGWRVVVEYG
jgi:hypothetical protein